MFSPYCVNCFQDESYSIWILEENVQRRKFRPTWNLCKIVLEISFINSSLSFLEWKFCLGICNVFNLFSTFPNIS